MEKIIFRNDDVCANTDLMDLCKQYALIETLIPNVEIWSAVSLFSKFSGMGSVYPEVPFKDRELKWFYGIDDFLSNVEVIPGVIASHGLFHVDHTIIPVEMQEMSIVTSCNYLNTEIFIPPFNRWNEDTLGICQGNGIDLVAKYPWKSLEFNNFDPSHKYWYFHSWKWTPEKLRKALNGHSVKVG